MDTERRCPMPAERLSMRNIREVLRLKAMGFSGRKIARSLGLSPTTTSEYLRRAKAAKLSWPLEPELDDEALERLLFVSPTEQRSVRPQPDWPRVHTELRRKHVTLALLWEEYRSEQPDGYQYSRFCELYRKWSGQLSVWMRQEHRGGEKLFVDYSGDGIPYFDRESGKRAEAQLFVAVLGASNYTFAEVSETQQLPDWLGCHVSAFEYIGGVPEIVVPDQPRTSVTKPCRYDPEVNPAYDELARHYETCVIPARPRKPRDKAKVEAGVLIAQRWIIAALRNRTFYSIAEINEAIAELLERINSRPMRRLRRSRRELFEELDQPNLRPLREKRFEYAEWKTGAKVNIDYHVEFEKNFYSVPYQLAQKQVDVRATARTVEVFRQQKRVASHTRLHGKFKYSTVAEHMPRSHREHTEWTPSRLIQWAKTVGESTARLVERIMEERPHPEQGFRACLGILRLSKHYGRERLENASRRALACHALSYRSVESILKNRLDDQPLPEVNSQPLPAHENLRGSQYYN
jgi:transposase